MKSVMHCFVNKQQLPVISTYFDYGIFVTLLLALGYRLDPHKSTLFRPSCADAEMMQRRHATPLQAWTGPEDCRKLRLLDSLDQRFSNFFQVGTTFISQNVLRTTLFLGLSNSLGLP